MPLYEYKGLNKAGKNTRGSIDAENSRTAKLRLKKQGIYVVDIKDKAKSGKKKKNSKGTNNLKVSVGELAMMTRQLSTLLKANIPLVDSLAAVAEQTEHAALSDCLADVKNMVNEGSSLHRALAKYPKVFNKIFLSMCEAGEMSGTLGTILLRLAEFTEAQNELRGKIKSAMTYPILMLVVTLLILGGIFIFIIPQMVEVFDSTPDMTLPGFTIFIIDLSDILVNYWYLVLGISFAIYLIFQNWKNSEAGGPKWDAIVLKMPIVGKLARLIAVSRFTRTLSTLLNGGVPMIAAMDIVRNVVDNEVLAVAIDDARDNIKEGESISGPLKKSGEFPPMVIHMINIGEKTAELENMLTQVSDAYDFQVNNAVEGLTSVLGPIMLVVMGGVIGGIAFAIMIPMFEMMNFAG